MKAVKTAEYSAAYNNERLKKKNGNIEQHDEVKKY
jgi:hypothetical protein